MGPLSAEHAARSRARLDLLADEERLPGMLLHATHNGLLVLIGQYQEQLTKLGIGVQEKSICPASGWSRLLAGWRLGWCWSGSRH